ncbi:hypothetical protein GVX82_02555 [Patescibacteria group bacterium]|jgi:putative transposase|nr:hypothetical protein [Patescibacteria group bacterium]
MEIWHVYNRGVDKRDVFMDDHDRVKFIHDLYEFNDSKQSTDLSHTFPILDVRRPVFERARRKRDPIVAIHAWCLMPNHFHLMVSELIEGGLALFMKKLGGGYTKYFNEKYERTGALWQGKYKRKPLTSDTHFLWLPLYIHLNPLDISYPQAPSADAALTRLAAYRWSSHLDYAGSPNFPSLIDKTLLLQSFAERGGYEQQLQQVLQNKLLVSELSDVAIDS